MRVRFLVFLMLLAVGASAQFPYHPLLPAPDQSAQIRQRGIRKLWVYQEEQGERVLSRFGEYNEQGRLITKGAKSVDNGDTTLIEADYFTYNTRGQLTKSVSYFPEEESRTVSVYTYDGTGKRIRKQTAEIDPPTYTYTYGPNGRLQSVLITQHMPDETEKAVHVKTYAYRYRYDAQGRLTEELEYYLRQDPQMTRPAYRTLWTYTDKGGVAGVRRVNESGTEIWKEVYTYGADGLIATCVVTRDETTTRLRYEYR